MAHRSINQRLRKTRSLAVRASIANEWASSWETEQRAVLDAMNRVIRAGTMDGMHDVAKQLGLITAKRFEAFPGVIAALTDDEAEIDEA